MFEDVMRQRRRKEEINENNRNSVCVFVYVSAYVFKEIEKKIQLNQNLLDQQELWRDGFMFTQLKSVLEIYKNGHKMNVFLHYKNIMLNPYRFFHIKIF